MAEGGAVLADILTRLEDEVELGKATEEFDRLARALCQEHGVQPAFLGYRPPGAADPYPAAICASINEEIVHGIPSQRSLTDGDILTIDMGIIHKGFYLDSAFTVGVGNVSEKHKRLLGVTREALNSGIAQARPGNTLGDIGAAISEVVESHKLSIVRGLTGHGIGRNLHEDPQVLNFGTPRRGEELRPGMVLAIEPMVAAGKGNMQARDDGSFVTADGSFAAHFEHTVAIIEGEPKTLTARNDQ